MIEATYHVILIYNAHEDSVTIDFNGSPAALAREVVGMANDILAQGFTWAEQAEEGE